MFVAVYLITSPFSPTTHDQVQGVPVEKFKDLELYPSPVLHVTASKDVEFLRPVTLKIPMSLDEDCNTLSTQFSCGQLRIFRNSEGEAQWEDITEQVKGKLEDDVVIFHVQHFSV